MEQIGFSYSNERNEFNHKFKNGNFSEIESIRDFNKNLLVNKGHFFTGSIHKLTMHRGTFYYSNDYDDFAQIVRGLEENGERVAGIFLPDQNFTGPGTLLTRRLEVNHDSGEEEESEEEEPIINADKSFKSDECVICLTSLPNVLFCNCGHIAICVECDKAKSLKNCPICKTENAIKRTI